MTSFIPGCLICLFLFTGVFFAKKDAKSQSHIFTSCSKTSNFWKDILSSFNWKVALPNNPRSLLLDTLDGHPFEWKKASSDNIIRKFFWVTWIEMNQRPVIDKEQAYDIFYYNIIYLAISWCKMSPRFYSYIYATLSSNWRSFLSACVGFIELKSLMFSNTWLKSVCE